MLFRQMESFTAVIEKGSISSAAASLGISQPAVSKHISSLENELGVKLFKRGHKCSMLTREGEIVYKYSKKIRSSVRDILKEVADASNEVSGNVSLSASSIPGDFVLPGLLVDFSARYPGIETDVKISDSKTALERLISRDADFAIIGEEKHPAGFEVHPFFDDEIVLVVKPDHILAGRDTIALKELSELFFIGRTEGSGTKKVLERFFHQQGIDMISTRLNFGHVMAVVNAVESGAEAGIVSKRAVRNNSRLAVISLDPPLRRTFYLIHGTVSTNAMGVMLDFLLNMNRVQKDSDNLL